MSLFADIRKRFDLRPHKSLNLAGSPARNRPEASSSEQPWGWREPHGTAGTDHSAYLAIAEALRDGADVVPASDEVGRRLAADGVSLVEALDGLSALYRAIAGGDFNHTTALILVDADGRILGRTAQLGDADPKFVKLVKTSVRPILP